MGAVSNQTAIAGTVSRHGCYSWVISSPMPEAVDLRCDRCGQGMRVQMVDTYNRLPPTHCPICGTPTLVRSKTHIVTSPESRQHYYKVDAKCFAGINPELV